MKRKMVALLTLALSVSLLGGCGGGSGAKAKPMSECLSKGKIIGYKVETVDKSETPENIYFFDEGKVTIIPGEEFGLTMGDFAEMKDKEIWSTYETVRETYIEEYKTKKVEEYNAPKQSEIDNIKGQIECLQSMVTMVSDSKGIDEWTYEEGLTGLAKDISVEGYSSDEETMYEAEEKLQRYLNGEITAEELESYLFSVAENNISLMNADIAQLQAEIDAVDASQCLIPFCDMPFQFVLETDGSGNNVLGAFFVHPTLSYSFGGEMPTKFYNDELSFAQGLTGEEMIYDTAYNGIAITGSGCFLTREKMEIDTLDSKDVLVDVSEDELNELFKEEVSARYADVPAEAE